MGLYNIVNRSKMAQGLGQDISDVVANFDALAAILNGHVDGTNIEDGSVTRTELATVARKSFGAWWSDNGIPINHFPDGVTRAAYMYVQLPDDYVSGDVTLKVRLRASVGGNNWRMSRATYVFRNGSVFNGIESGVLSTIACPAGANVGFEYSVTVLAANVQAGDMLRIDLQRLGADAADTNTGIGDVDGFWIEYTGRA